MTAGKDSMGRPIVVVTGKLDKADRRTVRYSRHRAFRHRQFKDADRRHDRLSAA
jgi:hypothetical protein